MLPTNMYYMSSERSFYSILLVCWIKIHAEIKELLQVKDWSSYIHCCLSFLMAFSNFLIKYSCYLTHKLYKMVDNKSKPSLIRHAHSYNIVIFICDIFFLYNVIWEVFLLYAEFMHYGLISSFANEYTTNIFHAVWSHAWSNISQHLSLQMGWKNMQYAIAHLFTDLIKTRTECPNWALC